MKNREEQSFAISKLRMPSDEVVEAIWENIPSAYEIDIEDRQSAMNLLEAIAAAIIESR